MGIETLTRAAAAAGYALAPIDEIEYDTSPSPHDVAVVRGEALARGARSPKGGSLPFPVAQQPTLIGQSIATGLALRQTVAGYIGGRGDATA